MPATQRRQGRSAKAARMAVAWDIFHSWRYVIWCHMMLYDVICYCLFLVCSCFMFQFWSRGGQVLPVARLLTTEPWPDRLPWKFEHSPVGGWSFSSEIFLPWSGGIPVGPPWFRRLTVWWQDGVHGSSATASRTAYSGTGSMWRFLHRLVRHQFVKIVVHVFSASSCFVGSSLERHSGVVALFCLSSMPTTPSTPTPGSSWATLSK